MRPLVPFDVEAPPCLVAVKVPKSVGLPGVAILTYEIVLTGVVCVLPPLIIPRPLPEVPWHLIKPEVTLPNSEELLGVDIVM